MKSSVTPVHRVFHSLLGLLLCGPLIAATPNIIVILADDVGWGDAGCYGGSKVKTPNIDRLARSGVRFTDGHASASVCTPTRYSMLTGQYSWRRQVVGLNKGVATGDAPLLIPTAMTTAPGLLKAAGYQTALIGKWHLGFGENAPDYNRELRPGPLEVGFHEFFGIPATNDRIPTVFVRDHRVVGLDPNDPIRVTYDKEQARQQGLSMFAAGRNRIGWGSGGKAAWWKDIDIADTHTKECLAFLERNRKKKFFLCFTPHDVHAPAIPHPRFVGSSGLGNRADMLHELDWSIGEILQKLDECGIAQDTLIIYSSDNGAYVMEEGAHKPNGPFRGKKSQLWEGGHRVPFVVSWPGKIPPAVSEDLVSTIDIAATICAAAEVKVAAQALPDSYNLLPAMMGDQKAGRRESLVVMSGNGQLALRSGAFKYIPDLSLADGWYAAAKKNGAGHKGAGLYDLTKDPGEANNLASRHAAAVKRMARTLQEIQDKDVTRPQ